MISESEVEKVKPTIVNLLVALYRETENFTDGVASKIGRRIRRNALRLSNAINSVHEMNVELLNKIIASRTSFIEKDLKEAVKLGFFDKEKLAFILVILAEIRIQLLDISGQLDISSQLDF